MRRLLLLVGALVFIDTLFFAALTPLLPHYVDELGLSKTGAGVLAASYPAGTLVAAVPSGVVTARIGVRGTALAGLAVLVVTTVVFGLARTDWILVTARFVQGASSAFTWTAGLTWLVLAGPAGRRGQLIGSALGAGIAGALCGPVLGGIAAEVGTGAAFGGVAVLAGVVGVGVWLTGAPAPQQLQPLRMLRAALRDPRVVAAMWFVMLPGMLFGVLSVLAPLRLSELGLGALGIGATWLVATGCEAAVSPVVGRASDRRGRIAPIRFGLLASAACALALPWPDRKLVLSAVIVAAAVSYGLFWAPAMSLLADASEARGLGYAYGFALMNVAWAPGQLIGAAVGGAVAQVAGDAVPYLVAAGICLLTLALLDRRRSLLSTTPAWRSESSS
jgi:MFS family permease